MMFPLLPPSSREVKQQVVALVVEFVFLPLQGWDKKWSSGSVNFVPAVAYHFCLNLQGKCSQPGDHFLAQPCKSAATEAHLVAAGTHSAICKGELREKRQIQTHTSPQSLCTSSLWCKYSGFLRGIQKLHNPDSLVRKLGKESCIVYGADQKSDP